MTERFTTADADRMMTEAVRFMQHEETGRIVQLFEGQDVPEGWFVIPNEVAFPPASEGQTHWSVPGVGDFPMPHLPLLPLVVQPNPHFKGSGLGADYTSTREEMREQIEASKAVEDAARAVVDAAEAYTKSVRASRSVYGAADEFAHQYFEGEQGELNAALLSATDAYIAARARMLAGSEE